MIQLGDIEFNTEVPDDDGAVWYCRLEGWDTVPHRTAVEDRPTTHGEITLDNKYAAKQITMIGTADSQGDPDAYWAAYNGIVEQTNFLTYFTDDELLLAVDEDITRQMRVVRTGIQRRCALGEPDWVLAFELNLRADDPRKYDTDENTISTSGPAVNAGHVDTYPTFTLTAPGTPILTAGAVTWQAIASLPSGTVIDMGRQTVLDGDTNMMANVDPASIWFPLEPGSNALTSTVAGTWSWRDAWL